VHLNRKTFKK